MPIAFRWTGERLLRSSVVLTSQFLSTVLGDATVFCCGGSNVDFIQVLQESRGRTAGIQYPFSLTPLLFEQLLHEPSSSKIRKIDMLPLLRTLLLRWRGLLDEDECNRHNFSEGWIGVVEFRYCRLDLHVRRCVKWERPWRMDIWSCPLLLLWYRKW